jgi:hypothetical protein
MTIGSGEFFGAQWISVLLPKVGKWHPQPMEPRGGLGGQLNESSPVSVVQLDNADGKVSLSILPGNGPFADSQVLSIPRLIRDAYDFGVQNTIGD